MADTTKTETATPRKAQGRSPNYPGIDLQNAIERAKVVWREEKRNKAPARVIMKHWGYTNPAGGNAGVTFGSLKKFGLLQDEGSGPDRQAHLTDLAFDIINNPDPSASIQKAALSPPIHADLWAEYGIDLPSDDAFRWKLLQRGFTESGATEFIREYRSTIAFAKLGEAPTGGDADDDTDDDSTPDRDDDVRDDERTDPAAKRRRQHPRSRGGMNGDVLTIPVPIIGGSPVTIEGQFPISDAAWTQFIAVLNAMKPGLVVAPDADADERD